VPRSSALPTWRPLLLAVLCAAVLLAWSPSARAGSYVIYQCRTPSGTAAGTTGLSTAAWAPSIDHWGSTCPVGGYNLQLAPGVLHPKDDNMTTLFTAPANTMITAYSFYRSVVVGQGTHYFYSTVERANGTETRVGTSCRGDGCKGVGTTSTPLSPSNLYVGKPATPLQAVGLYLSCGYYTDEDPDCAAATPAISAMLYRADITLFDGSAPAFVTTPAGPLLSTTATLTGSQSVSFQVGDKGGGVALVGVEIDGNVVASGVFGDGAHTCAPPYTAPVPCPLAAGGTLSFDTSKVTDGTHRLRMLVRDAGGNETAWGPITIKTYNTPPDLSCVPSPVVTTAGTLKAALSPAPSRRVPHPKGSASLTVPYGAGTVVGGTLRDAAGHTVAGASVCLATQEDGTSGPFTPIAKVTTAANGTFGARVPTGSSRSIVVIARVSGGAVVGTARLRVKPRITARPARKSLHNGQVLIISGRISGGPIPQRGVALNLQAVRDGRWQGFADAFRTTADGTFRFRYRFTRTLGVQRYRLRIRAYAQAGYPYQTGFSRAMTIRVRGS
jgi:hypothetical protein